MRVVAEYTRDEFWQRDTLGNPIAEDLPLERNDETFDVSSDECLPKGARIGARTISHYEDVAGIHRSAESGCHICSILADQQETPMDSKIHLKLGKWRFKCGNIQGTLFFEDTMGNRKGSMALTSYRHPSESAERMIQKQESSSDSLFNRYRWCKSTSAPFAFDMINYWIRNCRQCHTVCGQRIGHSKPTRLLDLAAFEDSDTLRLVLTEDILGDFEYATLSYRWSGSNPLVLRAANQDSLKSQITLTSLSQTVQEAIKVCRSLCMRYLWVDALCIMQEVGEDFEREVSKMDAMYAGSLFTIAAADSSENSPGCFRAYHPLSKENCSIVAPNGVTWSVGPPVEQFGKCQHKSYLESSVLNERGWVFQERVMSPRTIHFTAQGIILECRKRTVCHRCAVWKWPRDYDLISYNDDSEFNWKEAFSLFHEEWDDSERMSYLQSMWTKLAVAYDKTESTNEDDRLSALAGLARVVRTKSTHAASYGLWLEFFLHELQWHVQWPYTEDLATDDTEWHSLSTETLNSDMVPSWSWLRVPGKHLRRTSSGEDGKLCAEITKHPPATPFAQLSSLRLQNRLNVSFRVRGQVCSFTAVPRSLHQLSAWTLMSAPPALDAELTAVSDSAWSTLHAPGTLDATSFVWPERESWPQYFPDRHPVRGQMLQCVLLQRRNILWYTMDTGLVLEAVDETFKRFRRVGFFEQAVDAFRITEGVDAMPELVEHRAASCEDTVSLSDVDSLEDLKRMLDDLKALPSLPDLTMFSQSDDAVETEIEIE